MKILRFAIYLISVCVDVYAFFVGINEISYKISHNPSPLLIGSIWIIFIGTFVFVIMHTIHWAVKRKCQNSGTHNIPCSLYSYYRAKLKNQTKTALHAMHFVYHSMYEQKEKIRNNRMVYKDLDSIKGNIINPFLEDARMALQTSLGIDVNISIKLLKKCNDKNILETYFYLIKSLKSEDKREVQNSYILLLDASENLVNYNSCCSASIDYNRRFGNEEYATNSIFNYLMIKENATDWLSNDLEIDEKEAQFYSSSKYRKCYRSLAVFVIKAPQNTNAKGLLTFDSEKPNLFVEKECREIMGFIAHCLFEIINETYYVQK